MNKGKNYILTFVKTVAVCILLTNIYYSQIKHPYASDKPITEPVVFKLPGVDNPWHFTFTPDGRTVYFLVDGGGMEVVHFTNYKDGQWSKDSLAPFSGKYRIETPCISPNGSKFYFALPVQINGNDHVKLYEMDKTSSGWSEPRVMSDEINIGEFQNCPRAVNNGTLYFTSNKDGGFHIYRSRFENGKYLPAEKLDSPMGMYYSSDFCIAPDESYIIFGANYNLYISFNINGKWTSSKSLGQMINTTQAEVRPLISPDGNYLFFKRLNPENWLGPNYQIDLKPLVDSARKVLVDKGITNNLTSLTRGKKVISLSNENRDLIPENAVDGSSATRWSSAYSDNQWLIVDLENIECFNSALVNWEAYAEKYKIEVSDNLSDWKDIYHTDNSSGGLEMINFPLTSARFVKLTGIKRGTPYGFSVIDFDLFYESRYKQTWQQCKPIPEKMNPACGIINKKIYSVKGCSGDFKTPGCVYEYNPANDSWSKKADMPIYKYAFQSFVLNNKLYTIGGISDSAGTRSSTLEEYDPVSDRWTQKASMKVGREGIGIIVYKNKVYALGGFKAKNDVETNTIEVYNPKTDLWETKAPMPTGRAWIRACCLNDKFYAFGGYGNGRHQASVEEYNPETDTWTSKPQAPHEEPIQYAKNIKGNIYTVSSAGHRGSKSFLDKYDPVSDTWTSLTSPIQSSFFDFASLETESDIFIISGFQFDPNNVIKTVQRYNISDNKWDRLPDLSYGRVAMGAEILDDTIYIIGGQFGWYTNPIQFSDVIEKLDLKKLFDKIN